jgi:hypothetical protein
MYNLDGALLNRAGMVGIDNLMQNLPQSGNFPLQGTTTHPKFGMSRKSEPPSHLSSSWWH